MANVKRDIVSVMVFKVRGIFIHRLWQPETKDQNGAPLSKPSYSISALVPKTKARWSEEPEFITLGQACLNVWQSQMPNTPANILEMPVKDGDKPNKNLQVPEWAAGNWILKANTTFVPRVEAVIEGGSTVEVPTQMSGGVKHWKDGDYVALALGIAKRATDMVGIKAYLNSALFTQKGEEIALGTSVTGNDMMAAARAQGINLSAFAGPAVGGAGFQPFKPFVDASGAAPF